MKRLIRLAEVISTSGLCRSEIYRLEGEGKFPKRVPLSKNTTAWDADEVQDWVRARIAAREETIKERESVGARLVAARGAKAKPAAKRRTRQREERAAA